MGLIMKKIDWNLVGIYICIIGLLYSIFLHTQSKPVTEINVAKCESVGGSYGGGKCFVKGVEVNLND